MIFFKEYTQGRSNKKRAPSEHIMSGASCNAETGMGYAFTRIQGGYSNRRSYVISSPHAKISIIFSSIQLSLTL